LSETVLHPISQILVDALIVYENSASFSVDAVHENHFVSSQKPPTQEIDAQSEDSDQTTVLPGTARTGTETGAEDPSHPSKKLDELNSNQDGDSTISTKTSQQSYDDKDGCISSTNTTSVHHSDSNHSMQEDSPDSSTPTPKSLAPSSTIQDWKKYINFKQLKNNTPTQNVADQGATTLTVCGCLGQFSVVPNCHQIQFMKPPLEHTTINDLKMKEFLEILEHFTDVIQEKLPLTKLHKIFDKHCNQIKDENQRPLVIIDGGRYEFYIP
jgi:hypothetical protein